MDIIQLGRTFLKAHQWGEWRTLDTDQKRGVPMPPIEKPCPEGALLVDLVAPENFTVGRMPLIEAIARRRSRREFSYDPLTLEELSFLLWATQGVNKITHNPDGSLLRVYRTVPSAGCRHPFETYVLVNRVEGVAPGLYRYLPMEHKLCLVRNDDNVVDEVHAGSNNQYVRQSAVTFIWTVIPYRTEWRYSIVSHKPIALDAGHVCQNLYLACEAIGAGTVAIGAYDQAKIDPALGVDGENEFTIYMAPVGRAKE